MTGRIPRRVHYWFINATLCHESRQDALRHTRLRMSWDKPLPPLQYTSKPTDVTCRICLHHMRKMRL